MTDVLEVLKVIYERGTLTVIFTDSKHRGHSVVFQPMDLDDGMKAAITTLTGNINRVLGEHYGNRV
jgi:hypothetical protein